MHFLVSGIPASGKSTFCRWLEAKRDFVHLDVEKSGVLDRNSLTTAWHALFEARGSAALFIEALKKFNRPVVIDWGFPPEHLKVVRRICGTG
jgi:broad-specificity NMP kinase